MKKNVYVGIVYARIVQASFHAVFLAGIASVIYGVSLWSRPLAFVVGGFLCSAVAFLAGYGKLDLESRR